MREYVATRVSPGSALVLKFDADEQMNLDKIIKRTISEIRNYYKGEYKEVIEEFSHVFKNLSPPYATIVVAIAIGYGELILEYHTYIVHKPNKLHE